MDLYRGVPRMWRFAGPDFLHRRALRSRRKTGTGERTQNPDQPQKAQRSAKSVGAHEEKNWSDVFLLGETIMGTPPELDRNASSVNTWD
jgi:hypothetical protein